MIWAILVGLVVVVPILFRGWMGWRNGATTEMRNLLVTLFAVLVAIRFWRPVVETLEKGVTLDARVVAVGVFAVLFLVASTVMAFAVRLRSETFRSVAPDPVNKGLGVVAGVFGGSVLGCTLALVIGLVFPEALAGFGSPEARDAVTGWPKTVYQGFEQLAGVAPDGPDRTRFPEVVFVEEPMDPAKMPTGKAAEPGSILVMLRPVVEWK